MQAHSVAVVFYWRYKDSVKFQLNVIWGAGGGRVAVDVLAIMSHFWQNGECINCRPTPTNPRDACMLDMDAKHW
jgi:hypothetical protein